jgi:hypothetical protein
MIRKRPEAIPAYIVDWWRDGNAAIETGMATVGRRSGTINTREAVGMRIKVRTIGRFSPAEQRPNAVVRPRGRAKKMNGREGPNVACPATLTHDRLNRAASN